MYFESFSLGKPFLDKVNIYFYENIEEVENGYERKEIDSTIINVNSKKSETIIRSESISLFFNQNKAPILSEKYIRRAIDSAVNREAIVSDIFNGIAEPLNGPIPEQISPISDIDEAEYDPEESSNILEGEGWELNEEGLYEKDGKTISIKIATNNTETLLKTGEHITENLRNLGFDVSLEIYEENDLIQKIIRPRNFQILLFGTVINHGLDMYGFWHSSQRNDPGVNITQYTNIDVDSIVSKLRTEQDPEQRLDLYSRF
jgi:peptide/nickel transport system substrate-binding protein